jgi:hypothetical protein
MKKPLLPISLLWLSLTVQGFAENVLLDIDLSKGHAGEGKVAGGEFVALGWTPKDVADNILWELSQAIGVKAGRVILEMTNLNPNEQITRPMFLKSSTTLADLLCGSTESRAIGSHGRSRDSNHCKSARPILDHAMPFPGRSINASGTLRSELHAGFAAEVLAQ